ncbi:MAG: PAS domain-containing protein [Chitinophagales bacterium]
MNISVLIDEHFQIVDTEDNIFDKVSSHITRIIGGLVHQCWATKKEASVRKLQAKTIQYFTFLTITVKPVVNLPSSIKNKIICLSIQENNKSLTKEIEEVLNENTSRKLLTANSEKELWDFLAEAEMAEMEEAEINPQQSKKVNERLESLLREAEKQGLEWIKTMNDLTLSMIKLKESEETKKALLEAVPDAMFRVNREGTYLQYIPAKNENAVPASAFIGNKMEDVLPEEYAQEVVAELQLSLDTAKVRAYSFEWELEENLRYFEMRFSPINTSEALCMIRDITEQKRGEELLRKSKMYYKDLIKRSPAPILVLDKDGNFMDVNPAALRLLGAMHNDDLKDKKVYDFFQKKSDRSIAKDRHKRAFVENFPEGTAEYKIIKLNKEEIKVEVAGTVMNLGGKRVAQLVLREVK